MSEDSHPCFRLRHVKKTYSGRGEESPTVALDCVSIDIPWNACVAVLGHSGSGKSTLLNLLGALDKPDLPRDDRIVEILYDGTYDLAGGAGKGLSVGLAARGTERFRLRRREFGFVFQFHHLLDYLNCCDNATLQLGLIGVPSEERRRIGQRLLQRCGMERHADKLPAQLSGGESQRIAVLRAIAHDPRVVLADEPTGNLDATNAGRVLDVLLDWHSQTVIDGRHRTLLLATHNVNDAFLRCNYFLVLRNGIPHRGRLIPRGEIRSAEALSRLLVTVLAEPQDKCDTIADEQRTEPVVVNARPPKTDGSVRPGYLFHLGRREFRRHCWSALTSGLMLFMLVVLVVVGAGLLEGKRRSLHRELAGRLALRLDANCLSRSQGTTIDPPLLQRLTAEIIPPARLWTHSAADLHPWNLADEIFWEASAGQPTTRVDHYVSGRTAQADDPIVAALVGDDNRASVFSADTAWEIVVTEAFLKECNYAADAPVVWLDCNRTPVPLVIRRVVKTLPGAYHFLMPDGLYREISADGFDPDPLVSSAWLEPFTTGESEAVAAVTKTLSNRNLELHLVEDRLEIRVHNNRQLPASRLRKYAEEVRALLREKKLVNPTEARICQTPAAALQSKQAWTYVGIDAASIDDLQPLADLISPCGLDVDPHYIEARERLRRTVGPLAAILVFVVLVAGFVVTVNFLLTSWQRVVQSRYQLGILKAGGMLARHITLLLVGQAAVLGALAGGAGIVVGRLAGQCFGDRIAEGWFCFSPGMAAILLASTIAITVLACLLGTVWTIRRQPVDLLVR